MTTFEIPPNASTHDVMVVLLGAALLQMEIAKLTVGQTADHLLRLMDREGYEIKHHSRDERAENIMLLNALQRAQRLTAERRTDEANEELVRTINKVLGTAQ
jgi:hypothetical protein